MASPRSSTDSVVGSSKVKTWEVRILWIALSDTVGRLAFTDIGCTKAVRAASPSPCGTINIRSKFKLVIWTQATWSVGGSVGDATSHVSYRTQAYLLAPTVSHSSPSRTPSPTFYSSPYAHTDSQFRAFTPSTARILPVIKVQQNTEYHVPLEVQRKSS